MAGFKYTGFKSLKFFKILEDGTLDSANPIDLGKLYQDTVKFTRADATTVDHFAEGEPNSPEERFSTKGVASLAFSLMQLKPESYVEIWGGSVTVVDNKKVWKEPREMPLIRLGAILITKNDLQLTFNKLDVQAKENYNFMANQLLMADFVCTVMNPDSAVLSPTETQWPEVVEVEEP